MKSEPCLWRHLSDVKASFFHDHFVVQYSEQGSNGRTAEEAFMLNWAEYINECASGTDDVASMTVCMRTYACVYQCMYVCVLVYISVCL